MAGDDPRVVSLHERLCTIKARAPTSAKEALRCGSSGLKLLREWFPHDKSIGWAACAALFAVASAPSCQQNCSSEATTGVGVFALLTLSRSAWQMRAQILEIVCRLRTSKRRNSSHSIRKVLKFRSLLKNSSSLRLQPYLKEARREAIEAQSDVEMLKLENERLEARCRRSESLREQLHSNFNSVLARLEQVEQDDLRLRQDLLRLTTLASPSSSSRGMVPGMCALGQPLGSSDTVSHEALAGFTYAPSTPSSRRDLGNSQEPGLSPSLSRATSQVPSDRFSDEEDKEESHELDATGSGKAPFAEEDEYEDAKMVSEPRGEQLGEQLLRDDFQQAGVSDDDSDAGDVKSRVEGLTPARSSAPLA